MGNTNLWKNNKKNISDWPIKSCSSNANFFANQKPVSMLIWFWQVICVHTNLIRLEIIKKNVYLNKFRNHATTTFCSKSFFFWFLKVISMLFLRRCYSFMLVNLSNLHTAVLILSTRECVSSWLTDVHSPHLKKCTFSFSIHSPFMLLVFLH